MMPETPTPVEQFVSAVGKRIDSHRARNIAVWAALIGGAAMLSVAIWYVCAGYRVPWMIYLVGGLLTLWCGVIAVLLSRSSRDEAASFADRFFDLKNAVESCQRFSGAGKAGGFYDLQAQQTQTLVDRVSVETIQYRPPWKIIATAAVLVGAAVSLGFKPTSSEVLANLQQQQDTLAMTAAANAELEKLVEELQDATVDEDERTMLNTDKLRQWVAELKETTDLKDARRQYAKMEMRVNRAVEALQQRRDESLLDKAAEELKKDPDSKEFGKSLKHKKYDQAARQLKDLKPEKLSESRKELARLKAAANRMAAAARETRSNNAGQQKRGNSGAKPSDGDPGDDGQQADDDLAQLIDELDDAVEALDRELEELELIDRGDLQQAQFDDDLEEADAAARAKLGELGDRLMKMARRRKARQKLRKLSKRCAQCQSSARSGDKKAGRGSDDSSRAQRDKHVDNGQTTKLKGIKGKGPSLTQVEAAEDGDGTSYRRSTTRERDFKRQFESFVDREDIPDDLKSGVKNYFSNIHEGEQADQ